MKCPTNLCSSTSFISLETHGLNRRRRCTFCKITFWTTEVVDETKPIKAEQFKTGKKPMTVASLPKFDRTKNAFGTPLMGAKPEKETVIDPNDEAELSDARTVLQKKIDARHKVEEIRMRKEAEKEYGYD